MAQIRNLVVRISVTENTDKGIRRVTTSLRETNRELDRANKDSNRFTSTLSKLGRTSLSGVTKGLTTIVSASAKAAIGLAAVGAAAASINTAIQAGAALAPLTGLLALLPGAAVGAATALVSLKVATSGVGDAFKEAFSSKFDPKKFAASLKDLSPAARSVAVELHKLRPELIGIRNTAQQALFDPLRGQLTALAKALGGTVSAGISRVAVQIGLAGRQVAEFARQRKSVQFVAFAFNQTQLSLGNLRSAIQPVLTGLRSLATVGLSFPPGLSASAASLATRFGEWAQKMAASGKAAEWIRNALATLKQLGGILKNVGGILGSVFKAASAAGSGFLGVIGQALAKLNAFLKTAQGQAALKSIFQGLAAIGTALGPVIAAVVTQLGTLAAPVARLITLVGPLLTSAINALAPALIQLEPGLAAIFSGFNSLITAIAPTLPILAAAISQVGAAIGRALADPVVQKALNDLAGAFVTLLVDLAPLLPVVANVAGILVSALAPVIPPLASAFATLATVVGQQLARVIVAIAPYLPQLAVALSQILIAAVPLVSPLASILIALTPLIPVLAGLIRFFAPLTPLILAIVIAIKTWTIAQTLLNIVLTANPIGFVIVAIATLVAGVIYAYKHFDTFRAIVDAVFSWLKTAVVAVINFVGSHWRLIISVIGGPIGIAVALITKYWRQIFSFISGTVSAVIKTAGNMIHFIAGIPGSIFSVFKNAGKWLVQTGKNIVIGLWNGIASLGSWIWHKIMSWAKAVIPGPILHILGIASPSKVMAQIGVYAGQGLAQGILGTAGTVANAASVLAKAAVPAIPGTGAGASSAGPVPSAAAPRGISAAAVAGGGTARVIIDFSGADSEFKRMFRKMVRIEGGGSVEVAFGSGSG